MSEKDIGNIIKWGSAAATFFGGVSGCAPKDGIHPSQIPTMGETPSVTQLFTPVATENPFIPVPPENMMTSQPAFEGMELPAETIEFKAGIPATMEECNVMELQYKQDGTIDRDPLTMQMKALSKVEHQWLADQGITAADVRAFNNNGLKGVDGFPYSMLPIGVTTPTSCTRINFQGHDYLMYGFAGKHSDNSTQIAIIHVIYDDVGNELFMNKLDQKDYFDTRFSPGIVFENMQTKPGFLVNVLVGGYGQSDNPEDIERWQLAKAINEMNKPVREADNKMVDERLAAFTNPERPLTPEEEAQWITYTEQSVFAAQTIGSAK